MLQQKIHLFLGFAEQNFDAPLINPIIVKMETCRKWLNILAFKVHLNFISKEH